MTTYSRESDWIGVPMASTVASHRATTSSRHPGVVFAGTVRHQRNHVAPCSVCGSPRLYLADVEPGPHSPHLRASAGGELVLVDCVGTPLRGTCP